MDGNDIQRSISSQHWLHISKMYTSNKVGRVLLKSVGHDIVYLKAEVEPSQSLKVAHHKDGF